MLSQCSNLRCDFWYLNIYSFFHVYSVVPAEPTGVKMTEVTSTTLVIEFEPPENDGNLPIIGYTVEYWRFGDVEADRDEFNGTSHVKLSLPPPPAIKW